MWKSMASWLGPKGEQKQKAPDRHETQLLPDDDPETIHIFTVASGHLYERLQKIMVLSALRQTKCVPSASHAYLALGLDP